VKVLTFWVAAPCSLASRYQRFGKSDFSPEDGDFFSETLVSAYETHGVTTQNIISFRNFNDREIFCRHV
jgi:hypothetical protein